MQFLKDGVQTETELSKFSSLVVTGKLILSTKGKGRYNAPGWRDHARIQKIFSGWGGRRGGPNSQKGSDGKFLNIAKIIQG